ncbi:MAG: sulfotransferase, partial [Methyloceanibacter sp.]
EAALLAFFRSCASRHVADIAENIGAKSVLVLKDPNLVQVDAETAAIFPDAIRIACLRDPRDIAASFLRIGQRERPEGQSGKYRRRDIDFIGKKILASYAPLMGGEERSNLHLVRYEDVATKPGETLEMLARATGLELSLERIDNPVWLDADARHEASWISELEGQGPSSASVGAYKTVMRPNEIALTEQICSPFMAWAGYERSTSQLLPPEWGPRSLARRALNWARRG